MESGLVFEQRQVKQFITDENLGKLPFNEHPTAGAHASYMTRAAKAAGLTVGTAARTGDSLT